MEYDDLTARPLTARERMDARNLMAEHAEVFGAPEECYDCETFNELCVDVAEEIVRYDTALAVVAQSLCYFKEQCKGAVRDDDGEWIACGSHPSPAG